MRYTDHAKLQMAAREITESDIRSVIATPTKELPAKLGRVNIWGHGVARNRIRITLDPTRTVVITVANAGERKPL